MHSLDEPLDLKLSISKLRAARDKRERGPPCARPRAPPRQDAPPAGESRGSARGGRRAGPAPGLLAHSKLLEKRDGRFPPVPVMDLSLSPPPGVESPGGSAPLSPERPGASDLPLPAVPHVRFPVPALHRRHPQLLPVLPAAQRRGGPAPALLRLPAPPQGQAPLPGAAPAQTARLPLVQVQPVLRPPARPRGPRQRLPRQAREGRGVLLPLGGLRPPRPGLQRQVQDADPHPDAHQREAASLPHLQQELLPPGEPEDPQPLAHRREALHLPLRRLQQALLQLQRPLQAHPHPLRGEALLLQDAGLPQALHGPQLAPQAHQGPRPLRVPRAPGDAQGPPTPQDAPGLGGRALRQRGAARHPQPRRPLRPPRAAGAAHPTGAGPARPERAGLRGGGLRGAARPARPRAAPQRRPPELGQEPAAVLALRGRRPGAARHVAAGRRGQGRGREGGGGRGPQGRQGAGEPQAGLRKDGAGAPAGPPREPGAAAGGCARPVGWHRGGEQPPRGAAAWLGRHPTRLPAAQAGRGELRGRPRSRKRGGDNTPRPPVLPLPAAGLRTILTFTKEDRTLLRIAIIPRRTEPAATPCCCSA